MSSFLQHQTTELLLLHFIVTHLYVVAFWCEKARCAD